MYKLFCLQTCWLESVGSFETLPDRYSTPSCDDRDRVFALLNISQEVVIDRRSTVA